MKPLTFVILLLGVFGVLGCGGDPAPAVPAPIGAPATTGAGANNVAPQPQPAPESTAPIADAPAMPVPPAIPTISLNGTSKPTGAAPTAASATTSGAPVSAGLELRRTVLSAMDPLQIMLGKWRGTTQKPVGDFKGLDEPEWVWDFKTNRDHPSMVMKSTSSAYFREARLTYLPDRGLYQLLATDAEGKTRQFEGKFEQAAEKFQGDDDRLHIKYKLVLDQTNGTSPRDTWQVVFNQQENNRYLMEMGRQQSGRFLRFDTVATQRQGTSFAKRDDDFGEKTCVISGGLGTIAVSYKGKSYWVCCTGCKAAFDEDPATWIAEFEAKKKS